MDESGYYQFPAISGDTIYFASEDDLWSVSANGGVARRLTSGLGASSRPAISQGGDVLAFSSSEEGALEVYTMPAAGGPPRRLTYSGKICWVVGWTPANHRLPNHILYAGTEELPFNPPHLRAISPVGGSSIPFHLGPVEYYSVAPDGRAAVLARVAVEAAHWKRYRGGTAGDLWVDADGTGNWKRLISVEGNPSRPMWIGGRIFFISDHEGVGNVYSCTPAGADLRRHTSHDDFYARNAASDGRRIVYQAGGDIFLLDPVESRDARKVDIRYLSSRTQRNRKFIDAARYLESYAPHPTAEQIAIVARGKSAVMEAWDGPVRQIGDASTGRHRLLAWLHDGTRVVTANDASGSEALAIHRVDTPQAVEYFSGPEIARVTRMVASPRLNQMALATVRSELVIADLETHTIRVLDRNRHAPQISFSFSPDGRFIAYNWAISRRAEIIRICRLADGSTFDVTRAVRSDFAPVFDPAGEYLYFLGMREFNPVYDRMHFDLGFPRGSRPYAIALRKDVPSRFLRRPESAPKDAAAQSEAELTIDFDGIEDRIEAFPVPEGIYAQIAAARGKVFFTSLPVEGALEAAPLLVPPTAPTAKARLEAFDFATRKVETWIDRITSFTLSLNGERLAYRAGNRIRLISTKEKPSAEAAGEAPGPKSGWIDLGRVRFSLDRGVEWHQMYDEAWRMQREQYWVEDMAEVDWQAIHDQYLPLVDRVDSRAEFEDLLWEMQGELGTSHAYAFGGDFRRPPAYNLGFLGADLAWDDAVSAWQITHIVRGDPDDARNAPPLMRPGVNLASGATILAINNRAVTRDLSPAALLVHQAGLEVVLTVADRPNAATREVIVKASSDDTLMRYREWVEKNRAWVHEHSSGRCGYVHIPDMGGWGYAEFHRLFLLELDLDGLIIDVRYNRGGHVSSLLLEKLARRRRGYDQSRYFGADPWPQDSPVGPMVALTNQHAGSDGDIFSHGFQRLKLGPLIGKRTWGGVIGISPRHLLADGGLTTQPEFAFWFDDVGWGIENRGAEPDIEVEYAPHDYAAGRDPQLERGLAELIKLIGAGSEPKFAPHPSRARRRGRTT